MSGSIQRDVLIRLTLGPNPSNGASVAKAESDIKRLYGTAQTSAEKAAASEAKASAAREKAIAKTVADAEKAAAKESSAAQKAADAKLKADNRVFQNRAKLLAQIAKEEEKRTVAAERASEREAAAAEKAAQRQSAAVQKAAAAEEAARQRAIASVDTYGRKLLAAEVRNERMSLGMVRSSGHLVHGFSHVAEGLTIVGAISEENNAKLLRTVAAVHGISEAFRGTADIVTSLVHLNSQLERSVRAVYDIEKLEASLQTARAVAGGAAGGAAGGLAARGASHEGSYAGELGEQAAFGAGLAGTGRFLGRNSGKLTGEAAEEVAEHSGGGMLKWLTTYGGIGGAGMLGRLGPKALSAAGGVGRFLGKTVAVPLAGAELIQGARRAWNYRGLATKDPLSYGKKLIGMGVEGSDESILHGIHGGLLSDGRTGDDQYSFHGGEGSTKDLEAAEARSKERHEEQARRHERTIRSAKIEDEAVDDRRRMVGIRGGDFAQHRFDQDQLDRYQRDEKSARADIEKSRMPTKGNAGATPGQLPNYAALEVSLSRQEAFQKSMLDYDLKRVESLERQKDLAGELVAKAREQVAEARKQVEAEQKKYESSRARVARLSKPMQHAVHKILTKQKAGQKLSDGELRILEESGVAGEQADAERTKHLTSEGRGILEMTGHGTKELDKSKGTFWKSLGAAGSAATTSLWAAAQHKAAKQQAEQAQKEVGAVHARIADLMNSRSENPVPLDQNGMPAPRVGAGQDQARRRQAGVIGTEQGRQAAVMAVGGVPIETNIDHQGMGPYATWGKPYGTHGRGQDEGTSIQVDKGDVAMAVHGVGNDVTKDINDTIRAIQELAHNLTENHKRLAQETRRKAVQMAFNAGGVQ